MRKVTEPEEILIRFKDNKISGVHYKKSYKILEDDGRIISEYFGDPQPIPDNLSETILGITITAALSTIAYKDNLLKDLESKKDESPISNDSPDVISKLNTVFKTTIPLEIQSQFAISYAIVRVLIQSGEIELAKSVIKNIEVPEELAPAKQSLIDILDS